MSRRSNRGHPAQEQTPLEQGRGRRLTRLSTNAVEPAPSTVEKRKAPGGRIQKRVRDTEPKVGKVLSHSSSGRNSKQATVQYAPARATVRYAPARIDDSSEEEEFDQEPPVKKVRKASRTPAQQVVQREAEEDEDPDDEAEDTDMPENERELDTSASHYLTEESVQFTNNDSQEEEEEEEVMFHSSRSSRFRVTTKAFVKDPEQDDNTSQSSRSSRSRSQAFIKDPEQDDNTSQLSWVEGSSVGDVEEVPQPKTKISKHKLRKAQQLQYERPQIRSQSPLVSRTTQNPTVANHSNAPSSNVTTARLAPALQWKERSNILVTGKGRSFTLSLTGQPSTMRTVIDNAITRGKVHMLFDHNYSPVGPAIKQIASASLSEVAEDLNYNEDSTDICARLEFGDNEQYIKPLINYVSGRIGVERNQLKLPASVVLQSFGFDGQTGHSEAQTMIRSGTYLYPQDVSNMIPPDYRKPFEHPVFINYIREAFFSSGYYAGIVAKNTSLFQSSIPAKQKELEIPKEMLALASAAVHACLQDYSIGIKDAFPTKELDDVWSLAVKILTDIQAKNAMRYHKLMHKIYLQASGALSASRNNLTNQQIYDSIDWSAIEGDDDDDEVTSSASPGPSPTAVDTASSGSTASPTATHAASSNESNQSDAASPNEGSQSEPGISDLSLASSTSDQSTATTTT